MGSGSVRGCCTGIQMGVGNSANSVYEDCETRPDKCRHLFIAILGNYAPVSLEYGS